MTQPEMNAFGRCLERLSKELFSEILPQIGETFARSAMKNSADSLPSPEKLINEAQIRQYVLDPLLISLGWNLNSPRGMIVEAPAEPISDEDSRRFLDYLGRSSSAENQALLVVEAKRLSLELPAFESKTADASSFAAALKAAASKAEGVITAEWQKILRTLMDYANRLSKSKGGAPLRMALMNGKWIVVFLDPSKTLVQKDFSADDLLVAVDTASAFLQMSQLYSNLAFRELSSELPPQHYSDFGLLVSSDGGELDASFAVEVARGELAAWPLMALSGSVAVKLPSGAWVRFYDSVDPPRLLRDESELADDMKEITRRSTSLLEKLAKQRPLRLIDSAAYEAQQNRNFPYPSKRLFVKERDNVFVWYLGKNSAPITMPVSHEGCPYHSHGAAHAEGLGQPAKPILQRSGDPPAYFPSGSVYHCAHKVVHGLRQQRDCPIFYVEEQLCCRACSLQDRCWPKGFSELPCVQAEDADRDLLVDFGPTPESDS